MSQEVSNSRELDGNEAAMHGSMDSPAPSASPVRFAHELFEEQAARAPQQVALIYQGRQLTYAELDGRANQLAQFLRSRGVSRNTLVAISVDRSLEMAVGVLAVLKAGGACVPLDPTLPSGQLKSMLADAEPAILLTQSHLVADLPNCSGSTFLLDALRYAVSSGQRLTLSPRCGAEDLAYVLYPPRAKDGSKGVMITQDNLRHSLRSIQRATLVSESDVYLHADSIAWSSSVRQVLLPLSLGATVVIADAAEIGDPLVLFEAIKEYQVTVFDTVPSYWRQCLAALNTISPEERADLLDNKLGLVLTGGEPLPSELTQAWRFRLKHEAHFVNLFDLPETAGTATSYPFVPREGKTINIMPIGRAIDDAHIYLLDDQLQPVQFGELGEICVGGSTVGGGYLNDPVLSAERFHRDPFSKRQGARLYRTGNRGRLTADGTLEWHGYIEPLPALTVDTNTDVESNASRSSRAPGRRVTFLQPRTV